MWKNLRVFFPVPGLSSSVLRSCSAQKKSRRFRLWIKSSRAELLLGGRRSLLPAPVPSSVRVGAQRRLRWPLLCSLWPAEAPAWRPSLLVLPSQADLVHAALSLLPLPWRSPGSPRAQASAHPCACFFPMASSPILCSFPWPSCAAASSSLLLCPAIHGARLKLLPARRAPASLRAHRRCLPLLLFLARPLSSAQRARLARCVSNLLAGAPIAAPTPWLPCPARLALFLHGAQPPFPLLLPHRSPRSSSPCSSPCVCRDARLQLAGQILYVAPSSDFAARTSPSFFSSPNRVLVPLCARVCSFAVILRFLLGPALVLVDGQVRPVPFVFRRRSAASPSRRPSLGTICSSLWTSYPGSGRLMPHLACADRHHV